jgi:hypothetical protein
MSATFAIAACGDDDKSSEKERESGSPATAVAEATKTGDGLSEALATYRGGDHAAAADQVSETYLNHFEHVEGPLEKVDEELSEEIEDAIREELVEKMKAKASLATVTKLVTEIRGDLETAKAKLG